LRNGPGPGLQDRRAGADERQVKGHGPGRRHGEDGFSSTVGLVAMGVGLLLVALLLVFGLQSFGGSGTGAAGGGGPAAGSSILSTSSAESQIKLCSEGRPSTYGDPPTAAQQSMCVRMLLGQVSGGGPSAPGAP
jgi:hypothetical protein